MNKDVLKEIMHRTLLRNNFVRNRSDENKRKYFKQQSYCVSLLRKTKKTYYSDLTLYCIMLRNGQTYFKNLSV